MSTSVARHIAVSSPSETTANLPAMQQRSTFERQGRPDEMPAKERPPLAERLWRNQLGIALAIALTLAAASLLLLSRQV